MIQIKLPCNALITMGFFMSDKASSLQTYSQRGVVTSYDEESHYVTWTINDIEQPIVHINAVNFLL